VSLTVPPYLALASHQGQTDNSYSSQNTPAAPVCIHTGFESQAALTPEAISFSAGGALRHSGRLVMDECLVLLKIGMRTADSG